MWWNNRSLVNRGGVVYVEAAVSFDTAGTIATLTLPDHTFRWTGERGLIYVKVPQSLAAATVGVNVTVNGETKVLTTDGSTAATGSNVGAGVRCIWYDKAAGSLQVI